MTEKMGEEWVENWETCEPGVRVTPGSGRRPRTDVQFGAPVSGRDCRRLTPHKKGK